MSYATYPGKCHSDYSAAVKAVREKLNALAKYAHRLKNKYKKYDPIRILIDSDESEYSIETGCIDCEYKFRVNGKVIAEQYYAFQRSFGNVLTMFFPFWNPDDAYKKSYDKHFKDIAKGCNHLMTQLEFLDNAWFQENEKELMKQEKVEKKSEQLGNRLAKMFA
jgi:hypothetical protein